MKNATANFILSHLNKSLSKNKFQFGELSYNLANDLINHPYYKVALYYNFYNIENDNCNLNDIYNLIEGSINNVNQNFIYSPRKTDWAAFHSNEIRCNIINDLNDKYKIEDRNEKLIRKMKTISLDSFKLYFENKQIIDLYNEVPDFLGFIDYSLPTREYKNIAQKQKINIDNKGWSDYIIFLFSLFLPDFKFSKNKSNSQITRFLKPISEYWSIGFEFERNIFNNSKKSGFFEFPRYFNIILLNNLYDKNSKEKYIYKQEDNNIISLGIMGNPFFYYPSITPSSYYLNLCEQYFSGSLLPLISPIAKIEDGNDVIYIKYNCSDIKLLKQYVWFYIDILCYTSKTYIGYIEKSIKNIIEK